MNMAAEWNAIVLLDEADVFLQKRTPSNFSQNESVAGESRPTIVTIMQARP